MRCVDPQHGPQRRETVIVGNYSAIRPGTDLSKYARELLQMQLVEIGQAFGGRDHSTVIHSVDKVQTQLGRDRQFRERVESARAELLTV